MRKIAIACLLALAGCEASIISADENHIALEAGNYEGNPGPKASVHCAKYGKSAELVSVVPIGSEGTSIYKFACQ